MIYETAEDLSKEGAVADIVATRWGCRHVKLSELAPLDRALFRDETLKCYLEIKCRTNAHDYYTDYMIDAAKMDAGMSIAKDDGVPFFLIVLFTDGVYWVKVEEGAFSNRKTGGRTDRGDPNDIEVCCYVPMSLWRKLE
jgi:hypothetical protein